MQRVVRACCRVSSLGMFLLLREKGKGRENIHMKKTSAGCLPHTPHQEGPHGHQGAFSMNRRQHQQKDTHCVETLFLWWSLRCPARRSVTGAGTFFPRFPGGSFWNLARLPPAPASCQDHSPQGQVLSRRNAAKQGREGGVPHGIRQVWSARAACCQALD